MSSCDCVRPRDARLSGSSFAPGIGTINYYKEGGKGDLVLFDFTKTNTDAKPDRCWWGDVHYIIGGPPRGEKLDSKLWCLHDPMISKGKPFWSCDDSYGSKVGPNDWSILPHKTGDLVSGMEYQGKLWVQPPLVSTKPAVKKEEQKEEKEQKKSPVVKCESCGATDKVGDPPCDCGKKEEDDRSPTKVVEVMRESECRKGIRTKIVSQDYESPTLSPPFDVNAPVNRITPEITARYTRFIKTSEYDRAMLADYLKNTPKE